MVTTPSTGVSTPEAGPAPVKKAGRLRRESGEPSRPPGRPPAAGRTAGEFGRSVIRLRAARLMLAGPITSAALYGSKIGKRAAITSVVIAPWFTQTADGQFKLTMQGRNEFIEVMDGPSEPDPDEPPDAPVKTVRQRLDERVAAMLAAGTDETEGEDEADEVETTEQAEAATPGETG